MTTRYEVWSWFLERGCNHEHRGLKAAERCRSRLDTALEGGAYVPWEVRVVDAERPLSVEECDELALLERGY